MILRYSLTSLGLRPVRKQTLFKGAPSLARSIDPLKVPEVTVHIVGVMVGHPGDLAGEVTLKVQGHDLPLMADGGAQVVDGAAGGEELPMGLLPGLHGLAHPGAGEAQEEGKVSGGEQSPPVKDKLPCFCHLMRAWSI